MRNLLILSLISIMPMSYAQNKHDHQHQHAVQNDIRIVIPNKPTTLTINQPNTIHFQLLRNNQPLTLNDLKEVHTQKIHVLMVDSSLSDYHHIHPLQEKNKNAFVFTFTPKNKGSYKMWVDITPAEINEQTFIATDIGNHALDIPVKQEISLKTTIGPYEFTLTPDSDLTVGNMTMATITVTKNGKPFTQLEPVMGAYAHVVGFAGDHSSIMHIHPMGKEPETASDRSGPELMLHLEPNKKGFVKLFAQFRIDGQDIFVPFGVHVN